MSKVWDKFEWDDENKKNGKSSIYGNMVSNPRKLKNVFSTTMILVMTSGLTTSIFLMVAQIGADVCGSSSKIRAIDWHAFLRVGSRNPKKREKDEEAIWQIT